MCVYYIYILGYYYKDYTFLKNVNTFKCYNLTNFCSPKILKIKNRKTLKLNSYIVKNHEQKLKVQIENKKIENN